MWNKFTSQPFVIIKERKVKKMDKNIPLALVLILLLVLSSSLVTFADKGEKYFQDMQNFTYTYYQEDEPIKEINNKLQNYYEKILEKYGVQINRPIEIVIYPDIDSFHQGAKIPVENRSPGIVGSAVSSNKIAFVSPLNPGPVHNYQSIMKIAVHELVHIMTNKLNRNVPVWLKEGVSLYEARQQNKSYLNQLIKNDKIPSINKLEQNFYSNYGYTVSGTIVEYIVHNHGYEKLIRLIKSPKNFKGIFGLTKDDFFSNWKGYLYQTYN